MKKNFTLTKIALIIFLAFFILSHCHTLRAQAFTENFDDITTLAGNGWSLQNLSVPVGINNWDQGAPVTFEAQNGATNSYIAGGYRNTGNTGTISNWLITPNRTLRNGDVFTFYTRKASPDTHADRLEVRMSTNGASTNAGNGNTVGDFTTMLLSVNPTLTLGVYPTTWTLYTITISGLPAPTSGRVAFRYFVTSAGNLGTNSDYIGIDAVDYTPYVCPSFTMNPSAGALSGGTAGSSYSISLSQTGALGTPYYAITSGALPPGLTLSSGGTISGTPNAIGTFNFTVTVADASGCSGAQSHSLTIVCGANPTSLSFNEVCSNAGSITLTEGSPAGGTYYGTGVSGGVFDPASGTQDIYYDYTDPYGCAHVSSATLQVNVAPTVTFAALDPVCVGSAEVTLSGGSPAGGTYSGTDVSGNIFTPNSVGTPTISYFYTDANGCSNSSSASITVNDLPAVTASSVADVCLEADDVTLAFGAPAGGTYSGTNVSGNLFTPAVEGTNTISYSYTDANGCANSAAADILVNALPIVTTTALSNVCQGAVDVTLTGGSPAGGVYSGTNVTAGVFSPSDAGTIAITYTYTDANGCTASDGTSITATVCTDVLESSTLAGLKCFPNPGTGKFVVEFEQQTEATIFVQISNAQGNVVVKEEQNSYKGLYSQSFDLSTLSRGIYTMELRSETKTAYYKIVLQ